MNFGNIEYIVYILSAGSLCLSVYLIYILRKRKILKIIFRSNLNNLILGSAKIRAIKEVIIIIFIILFTLVL